MLLDLIFEVYTAVKIHSVIWNFVHCSPGVITSITEEHTGSIFIAEVLKTNAICTSESLVTTYQVRRVISHKSTSKLLSLLIYLSSVKQLNLINNNDQIYIALAKIAVKLCQSISILSIEFSTNASGDPHRSDRGNLEVTGVTPEEWG
jgi:hypothetical protein